MFGNVYGRYTPNAWKYIWEIRPMHCNVWVWYRLVWYGMIWVWGWEGCLREIPQRHLTPLPLLARCHFLLLFFREFSVNVGFHHQQPSVIFDILPKSAIHHAYFQIHNSSFHSHLCQGGGWLNITTGPPPLPGALSPPPRGVILSYAQPDRTSARNYIFRSSRGHVHCRPRARSNIFSSPTPGSNSTTL